MKRKAFIFLAATLTTSALLLSACSQEGQNAPVAPHSPNSPNSANSPQTQVYEPEDSVSASAVISESGISEPREFTATEVTFNLKTTPTNTATDWLDYEIINRTDKEYSYGEDFALFKNNSGAWVYTDMLPNTGWNDVGIILMPNSTNNGGIDVERFFGALEPGVYRLEKDVFSENEAFIAAVEFEVEDAK